jgi:hypothetical protein
MNYFALKAPKVGLSSTGIDADLARECRQIQFRSALATASTAEHDSTLSEPLASGDLCLCDAGMATAA